MSDILFRLLNGARRPSGLQLLRPSAVMKVEQGLAGNKGKAADFYRQVEGLIGPKQGQLYYDTARQLPGSVTQQQFLDAVRPRSLHFREGVGRIDEDGNYDPGLIDDLLRQRGHDLAIEEEFISQSQQDGLWNEVADALKARRDGTTDSDVIMNLLETDEFRDFWHGHRFFREAENQVLDDSGNPMTYPEYQRQFWLGKPIGSPRDTPDQPRLFDLNAGNMRRPDSPMYPDKRHGYFEATVQDPGLAQFRNYRPSGNGEALGMRTRDYLWGGSASHFSNPLQIGHIRGNIVGAEGLGLREFEPSTQGMAVEELQSDAMEELARYRKKWGAKWPAVLEAAYSNPHQILGAAALHRFADTPELGFFALPTPEAIGRVRGGVEKFHKDVYEKDLRQLYQLLGAPAEVRTMPHPERDGTMGSAPRYNVWGREQVEDAIKREGGIPYRRGGAVQSPAGGLQACSCGRK